MSQEIHERVAKYIQEDISCRLVERGLMGEEELRLWEDAMYAINQVVNYYAEHRRKQ